MCSIDEADPWTIFRQEHRTARKPHECYECARTITPGERYLYSTGLLDDRWFTQRVCEHCDIAAGWLRTMCGGFLYGGVHEELRDHWVEGYESLWLGRVLVGMGRQWRRRDGTGLMSHPPRFTCDHRYVTSFNPHAIINDRYQKDAWCACGVRLRQKEVVA